MLFAWVAQSDGSAGPPAVASLERHLFEAVNGYRRDAGLPALRYDDTLAAAARGHSEAMAAGKTAFGHEGLTTRAEEIGTTIALASLSENIARHSRRPEEVVDVTLRNWIASDAHRRNLRSDKQLTGVGIAQSPRGEIYVTQIFVGLQPGGAPGV